MLVQVRKIKIKELAEIIKNVVEFKGEIVWNKSKPDGTPRKPLNVTKVKGLGWKPKVDLLEGIKKTYDWYLKSCSQKVGAA